MTKLYKLMAIAMIMLVVTLPVYTAAYTGIFSYRITGNDGVNKAVRQKDSINIIASVSIEGDYEVSADQMWLGTSLKFDSCTKDINGYTCKLKYPKDGEIEFSKREPFALNLHSDDHTNPPISDTIIDSKTGYLVVDTYPPRIEASLDNSKAADAIKVNFRAYDDSYSAGKYDECSGLKSIEFYTPDKKFDKILDYEENNCYAESSVDINASSLAEGSYALIIDAVDFMGNKAKSNLTFTVDRTGAGFSNLRVLDNNGNEITHLGNNYLDAKIIVDASDDVKPETVSADLSAFNDKTNYKNLQGRCIKEENIIGCIWDVQIVPTAYGSKNLIFRGEDDIGNKNEKTIVKVLQKDEEGPKALSFKTAITGIGNTHYIRNGNNTIEIIFSESGSGLNKEDVMLDISSLGGPKDLKASSCKQGWTCSWEGLNFAVKDGIYSVSVNPSSKDRLGNKLREGFSAQVILDTSSPKIVNIDIKTIGSGLNSYEGVTLFGDSFEVTATVYENGMITDAYGDFSAVVDGAHLMQADECKDTGNSLWECKWITDPIDMSGYIKDKIKLSFKDFLGNIASYEKEVVVYAIQTSYTDYWKHTVVCSPASIDKEMASIIDQRIYCHVSLTGSAESVDIQMGDCTGDNSTKYVKNKALMNNQRGSKDPYIKLTLNPADIQENMLQLTCPLIIISKAGNSVTSIPEIENVQVNIPFYNSPLGEYGKNMQGKVDDAVDDATGSLWKIISALNKIVFYAERICSLITTINNIASLFNVVGYVMKDTAQLMEVINPVASQGLAQQGIQSQSVSMGINNNLKKGFIGKDGDILNKFCKFISCRLFYDEWGKKASGDSQGGGLGDSLGGWQRSVLGFANSAATGWGMGEKIGLGGQGINAYTYEKGDIDEKGGVSPKIILEGGKLNPKDSLILSFATLCIPGIVYNLDKYRQIKCMYADCLQTSIETGLPVYACEDAKEYETCKYIYGEIFQLLPFTGLLDYFSGLVKGVLYNPLGVIDLVLGYVCMAPVSSPKAGGIAKLCLIQEMAGMIADVWSDLSNLKDSWKINEDYCSRISEGGDSENKKKKSGLGGLFG